MAQCPICFSQISSTNEGDAKNFVWTDDPLLVSDAYDFLDENGKPTTNPPCKGILQIIFTHIKELQDNRQALESILLDAEDRTEFSSISLNGKFVLTSKHIMELRYSTEKLLEAVGMTKEDYFNYDASGIDRRPGNHKLNWVDAPTSGTYTQEVINHFLENKFQIKAIHIEELRHYIKTLDFWKELWFGVSHLHDITGDSFQKVNDRINADNKWYYQPSGRYRYWDSYEMKNIWYAAHPCDVAWLYTNQPGLMDDSYYSEIIATILTNQTLADDLNITFKTWITFLRDDIDNSQIDDIVVTNINNSYFAGKIKIDDEIISFTGKTYLDETYTVAELTGVTRGVDGTTPVEHSAGATVYQLDDYYRITLPGTPITFKYRKDTNDWWNYPDDLQEKRVSITALSGGTSWALMQYSTGDTTRYFIKQVGTSLMPNNKWYYVENLTAHSWYYTEDGSSWTKQTSANGFAQFGFYNYTTMDDFIIYQTRNLGSHTAVAPAFRHHVMMDCDALYGDYQLGLALDAFSHCTNNYGKVSVGDGILTLEMKDSVGGSIAQSTCAIFAPVTSSFYYPNGLIIKSTTTFTITSTSISGGIGYIHLLISGGLNGSLLQYVISNSDPGSGYIYIPKSSFNAGFSRNIADDFLTALGVSGLNRQILGIRIILSGDSRSDLKMTIGQINITQ